MAAAVVPGWAYAGGSSDFSNMPLPASLEDVRRIDYAGAGTLVIRQGERAEIVLYGSSDLTSALLVEVYDDVLYLEGPDAPQPDNLRILVTLPSVDEVVSHGPSVVKAEGLVARTLRLEALGAGSFRVLSLRAHELLVTGTRDAAFTLSGEVDRQVLDLADPVSYQARSLASESVEATIVGGGLILLQVDGLLDVRLAGTARLRYVGSPYVSQLVSGAGSVAPVGEISI
jgi:hypothetical protein